MRFEMRRALCGASGRSEQVCSSAMILYALLGMVKAFGGGVLMIPVLYNLARARTLDDMRLGVRGTTTSHHPTSRGEATSEWHSMRGTLFYNKSNL
jgi:hypothetical protein